MKKIAKIGLTAVGAYLSLSMLVCYVGFCLGSMKKLRQKRNGEISIAEYVSRIVKDVRDGYSYFASNNRPAF